MDFLITKNFWVLKMVYLLQYIQDTSFKYKSDKYMQKGLRYLIWIYFVPIHGLL